MTRAAQNVPIRSLRGVLRTLWGLFLGELFHRAGAWGTWADLT
jgi:hypothetical protein